MTSLVEKGLEWLKPLLKLRNELAEERNLPENRMITRRNGSEAFNGMGPYTPAYRKSILERLLIAQRIIQVYKPHVELISNQELIAIQTIWYRDFVFENKVSEIYRGAYKTEMDMKNQNNKLEKELELLKNACQDKPDNFSLIQDLLILQKNKSLLNRKRGLKDDLETRIEDYLKKEKANANKGN